jgi:hypothetical protein
MRVCVVVCLALVLGVAVIPAAAQEAEILRRELEQLKQQLRMMQEQYQKAIQDMTDRLQRLEAQPPATTPAPAAVAPAPAPTPAPVAATPPPSSTVSALELARPREPFALYERRGAGQLLFDLGVAANFVGDFTLNRGGSKVPFVSFPGEANRFFPQEVELSLFGQIDPYARATVIFEAGEELDEGTGTRSFDVSLAEAWLELMTLPFDTQVKAGLMRLDFGPLNPLHQHDRPFIDIPAILQKFFGDEGLVESGFELKWLAPTPFYLQLLAGVYSGDNEVAFGSSSFADPLVLGRARAFFDIGETSGLQLDLSGLTGIIGGDRANAGERASYLDLGLRYKYTPVGWRHALLTLGGELVFAWRPDPGITDIGEGDGAAATLRRRTRRVAQESDATADLDTKLRYGYYAYGELQPRTRWKFGLRYDWTEFPEGPGRLWAVGPNVTFMPSEFLFFRLGYKYTRQSGGLASTPDNLSEILFQMSFILGAHPAHGF